jgi:hypothetical protein
MPSVGQLFRSPAERAAFNNLVTGGQKGVFAIQGTVAYTDTAVKTLGMLPRGAQILQMYVDVTTAFNDSGTDQLSVGKSGTNNHFVSALDVSSTGRKAPTLTNVPGTIGASDIAVVGIYAGQNSNASTGSATVTILYVLGN